MTPIKFITGKAGTGKSTLAKKAEKSVLCSTTGISAVNMGTVTINSLLGYFDTKDFVDKFHYGKIQSNIHKKIPHGYTLIVDEVSMMDAVQVDYLIKAVDSAHKDINIIFTGDFCQLPPVDAPWAFTARLWEHPEREWETTKLTHVWRQDNPDFLEGLNFLREGRGALAIEAFQSAGVEFSIGAIQDFPGVTILGKNNEVDEWNQRKYEALPGEEFTLTNERWGQQAKEWKLIPEQIKLKVGAQVMLLANQYSGPNRDIAYANGDVGIIEEYIPANNSVVVKLFRGDKEVYVEPVERELKEENDDGEKEVKGGISFWPIRLAYASTVHKTQGLTLDYAQIDLRGWMMGKPAMTYVACSRVKAPQGLRIVGYQGALADRCCASKEALAWV